MSEINYVNLGEICEIFDGPHATPPKTQEGYVFLGISSLGFDGRINPQYFEYVDALHFKKWTRRIQPRANDIVFSYETKLGVAAIIPAKFECCLGRRMGLLRPNDKVVPQYLLWYYLSPEFQATIHERTYHGSTVDRIPLLDLPKFPIRLPPLPEQRAIASVLSSLDDKIDLLHRQNKTLEAMAETLFRQWFVEEAGEDWEEVQLGAYVSCINGVSYKSEFLEPSDTALVTLKNFDRNGGFRRDGFKPYSGPYKQVQIIAPGELAVAHTDITQDAAVVGNPIIVEESPDFNTLVVSMDLAKIVPNTSGPSLEFLYYLMRTTSFKQHCVGHANGSTVLHLSKQAIPTFEFFLPPAQKTDAFTEYARTVRQQLTSNNQQIRTLEKLRDTLLPKLMSGEVKVKV
jgi:type I restriction enzyme S subunit